MSKYFDDETDAKIAALEKVRDDAINELEDVITKAYGLPDDMRIQCGMQGRPEGERPPPHLTMNFPTEHWGGDTWSHIIRDPTVDDVVGWAMANTKLGWAVLVSLAGKLVGPAGKWNHEDHCDWQCRDMYKREVTTERADALRAAGFVLVDSGENT